MTDDVITQLAAARTNPSIIMVVGVGGAGGNAVNHMWNLGIKGVDFMVCNTDQQALDKSPVELKVRLGSEGLGAGNDPENGRKAAIESLDVVRQRFEASGTKMVFITAGMGGGTGTGASPVIAKLAKEIAIAAKDGTDPSMNARLRMAIEAAKKASMSRETLQRAIKKGAGLRDGSVQYDLVTYEGYAPHRVPVVVECLTENRNRTATNVRVLFDKNGGQLAAAGAVSWDFERLGCVEGTREGEYDAEEEAIEAGAQDLDVEPLAEDEAGPATVSFYTNPTDVDVVRTALEARGWTISAAKLIYKAKNPLTLDEQPRGEVEGFLGKLDDDDDVQNLYVGLA